MEAPGKIYLLDYHSLGMSYSWYENPQDVEHLTIKPENVEYIRKDLLMEWAKQKQYESTTIVADNFWQEVIDKINEI